MPFSGADLAPRCLPARQRCLAAARHTRPGGLPAGQLRFRILERDGFRCRYCARTAREPGVVLHVDHVVPLAAGGSTSEDNLVAACEECNLDRATRPLVAGS